VHTVRKCVAHSGSEDDKMRMIPARFVRVLRWIPRHFITHNLLIFQEIMSISNTCNQFIAITIKGMQAGLRVVGT